MNLKQLMPNKFTIRFYSIEKNEPIQERLLKAFVVAKSYDDAD